MPVPMRSPVPEPSTAMTPANARAPKNLGPKLGPHNRRMKSHGACVTMLTSPARRIHGNLLLCLRRFQFIRMHSSTTVSNDLRMFVRLMSRNSTILYVCTSQSLPSEARILVAILASHKTPFISHCQRLRHPRKVFGSCSIFQARQGESFKRPLRIF